MIRTSQFRTTALGPLVLSLVAGLSLPAQAPEDKSEKPRVALRAAAPPTITSFNPGSASAPGTWIYIAGSNLENATIYFNGVKSPRFDSYGSYGYASLPTGATTGKISAVTAYGTAYSTTDFVVPGSTPTAPSIASFTPTSGPVGTSVVITGANFSGVSAVRFNGTSAAFTVNSTGQITATVPTGATTGKISVVTAASTATSTASFTVTTPNTNAPTITSFSPASVAKAGVWVTINGKNLNTGIVVKFNGVQATSVTAYGTYAYALVPTGATTGPITVSNSYGTATSATSLIIGPITAPAVSGMSPIQGPVGTTVTLAGTNLSGATVRFNNIAAALTSNTATQIVTTVPTGATTGTVTVSTSAGSASAGTFTVVPNPTNPPTISSLSPTSGSVGTSVTITGTYLTGSTVKFGTVTASITSNSASQIITSVPSGVATGTNTVTVTTSAGSATSSFNVTPTPSGTDFTISKVLIGQATQRSAGNMRLAQDKRGFVQVFATATSSNTAKPSVKVDFTLNGSVLYTTTIAAPAANAGVPTSAPAYGDFTKTYVAVVPASAFKPGVQVSATIDTAGDPTPSNNTWTGTPDVRNTYPFRLTMVPLQIYYGGTYYTGVVNSTNVDRFLDMFQRIWPVPETIDRTVHATYYTQNIPYADYSNGWESVLNELGALATAEGQTKRYYYGVYGTYYGTAGGTGMAWLGYPQAMGIDWDLLTSPSTFTWRAGTVAHELGHSLNRPHTNCGGAGSPDASYPYSGGVIGTPGYDCWAGKVYAANAYYDVMGYCDYTWVSDYCVDKVMDFRLSGDSTVPGPVGPGAGPKNEEEAEECTMIWGTIENGEMKLQPAYTIQAVPTASRQDATYKAEVVSAEGQVLGEVAFEPTEPTHSRTGHLGFALAVRNGRAARQSGSAQAGPAPLTVGGIRLQRNGEVLAQRISAPGMLAAAPQGEEHGPMAVRSADRVTVTWDATRFPGAMIKNSRGEIISFAKGGSVSLPCTDEALEVHLSNGQSSHPVQVKVQ